LNTTNVTSATVLLRLDISPLTPAHDLNAAQVAAPASAIVPSAS
jgi:hypothetical protein